MFFGLLIRPFRGLKANRQRSRDEDRSVRANKAARTPLRLHWVRGANGRPSGHWDAGATHGSH